MKVKEYYLTGRKIILNSGNLMRLWQDPWMGENPLCEQFPILFYLCQDKKVHHIWIYCQELSITIDAI